jgi:prevent-host-death family protein
VTEAVNMTEARHCFSQLIKLAAEQQVRYLIYRKGKPVGAIVSAADLARLEAGEVEPPRRGLLGAVGALADGEDFALILEEVVRQRATASDRLVELDTDP